MEIIRFLKSFVPRIGCQVLLLIVAPLLMACTALQANNQDRPQSLTVFAASSLTEVMESLREDFQQQTGAQVIFNFAGSQRLRTQLELGAKADVFLSADFQQMSPLRQQGLLLGEPEIFAENRMVIITSEVAAQTPPVAELADLEQPGLKLVLAGSEVPAGRYARRVLEQAQQDRSLEQGFSRRVLANLVSEEPNVRSVAQKVALGEADAAIVYASDAQADNIRQRVSIVSIPDEWNQPNNYPGAVLKTSTNPALAQSFLEFLLSPSAQSRLVEHGFLPVAPQSGAIPSIRISVPG